MREFKHLYNQCSWSSCTGRGLGDKPVELMEYGWEHDMDITLNVPSEGPIRILIPKNLPNYIKESIKEAIERIESGSYEYKETE